MFSTFVHAPVDTIWHLLIDKIRHPDKYIAGVSNVEILEDHGFTVQRRMKAGDNTLTELITVDEGAREIRFVTTGNSEYQGAVINRIDYPTPTGVPILDFILEDHTGTPPLSDTARFEMLRTTVLHLKEMAEKAG